jgi:SIR2-like domain
MSVNDETSPMSAEDRDAFEIGGDDLLATVGEVQGTGAEQEQAAAKARADLLADTRIRVGTLLKTETVSFLLGAGASVDCGGQLISSIPFVVERELQNEGITKDDPPTILPWLRNFYLAVRVAGGDESIPVADDMILARRDSLAGEEPQVLRVNFERALATLHRWRSALPESGGRLRMDGPPPLDTKSDDLNDCLTHAIRALARACDLPISEKESGLATYKTLVRKLLTRPLNLKRVNIFSLNYDTLVEQAADAEGVVLLDGFVGTQRRVFRPESYEQDLYFPAETTEGRVHRFDRVLHLYKLHGSITWASDQPTIDNPYGVLSRNFDPDGAQPTLIYPTPAKYGETLGMPYAELFRRFATSLVRPQSVLFVIGYGFGDEHVNAIIRQALAVPSFTLVVVDPKPSSHFVTTLREQKDRRIWIVRGPSIGTLKGFADDVLPDLRDEDIRKKVLATHRALAPGETPQGDAPDGD